MRARNLATAPFRLIWLAIKVLFWPGVVVTLAWWWLPASWAQWVYAAVGFYLLVMVLIFRAGLREKALRRAFVLNVRNKER